MTLEKRERFHRDLLWDVERENDQLAGRLVFCYVMIAGLLVTIVALLCLWPN